MDLVPSHVVPSLTVDKEHNDVYSAYNKPGAVMYWFQVSLTGDHGVDDMQHLASHITATSTSPGRHWSIQPLKSHTDWHRLLLSCFSFYKQQSMLHCPIAAVETQLLLVACHVQALATMTYS